MISAQQLDALEPQTRHLMLAAVDNVREHMIDADLERLADAASAPQRETLIRFAEFQEHSMSAGGRAACRAASLVRPSAVGLMPCYGAVLNRYDNYIEIDLSQISQAARKRS